MAVADQIRSQKIQFSEQDTRRGFRFDVYLVLIVAALLAIGLLMVYSTTFDWSYLEFGSPIRIFLRQVRSMIIGAVMLTIAWRIDYRILRNRYVATGIMVLAIIALGLLLILNRNTVFGSQRSLYQGSYQPGEAAKLAVIIYFGAWLASRQQDLGKVGYGLIPFSILVGMVGGLIVLQPDLSTAAIIVLTAWTMFFVAGANIIQIVLAGAGAGLVGWSLSTQFSYARDRLTAHLVAMQDLTNASWHVQQAIIAFTASGSGADANFGPNWFGVGLGQSRQKFGFLPAAHTDSIFAIIGEELGLVGCLVVVILFVLFVWRGFKIASRAQDSFGSLLAVGIVSWIAYEALLNVAVMTAIIPFTGVPLPFISFGGSSLVVAMTATGLLLSVSRQRYTKPDQVRPLTTTSPEREAIVEDDDSRRRDRRGRVSRAGGRRSTD
jgi:cell division protein FtsW